MADGFYLEKEQAFIKTVGQSLRALPMVFVKLWAPILLAVLCKGLGYIVFYYLQKNGIGGYYYIATTIALILIQLYLWAAVLVGVNHLLSKFSAFTVASCFAKVHARISGLLLTLILMFLWVIYVPHIFIAFFSWVLTHVGMQGEWLSVISFVLGSLIVFSGIVTFMFIVPLVLFRNMAFSAAIKESADLVSPNWPYVAGVFAFCVLSDLLTGPHTLLFSTLFGDIFSILASLIISFVLYPFYLILILHALRFAVLRQKAESEG